jgi:hypothetical protein
MSLSQREKVGSYNNPDLSPTETGMGGVAGSVSNKDMQYSFMNTLSSRNDDYYGPTGRAIASAVTSDLKDRFDAASERLVQTKKQLRFNEKSNSGTSRVVQPPEFTSDYFQLPKPIASFIEHLDMQVVGTIVIGGLVLYALLR